MIRWKVMVKRIRSRSGRGGRGRQGGVWIHFATLPAVDAAAAETDARVQYSGYLRGRKWRVEQEG
jgi:hypothetical protein